MVRVATPDHAAPVLDIKLNQNPNTFFFPASTISGHVIYTNHYGNADYDLRLVFVGLNTITARDAARSVVDKATLFEYTFNLHTARKGRNHILANSQVDTAPMTFPFKHRFPSTTDNRSFSLASSADIDSAFSSHVHDLPPSFGTHAEEFRCSIEYLLRAELHNDDCLLGHCTVPVMFLPYMKSTRGSRTAPSLLSATNPCADNALTTARKDSLISTQIDHVLDVAVQLPSEITIGQPFTFEVQVRLPFRPEYHDEIPAISVSTLPMLWMTRCRSLCRTGSAPTKPHHQSKSKSISLHPRQTAAIPTLDGVSNVVHYTFQATLSSFYPPSFRSFLVSSSFSFDGRLPLVVDGRGMTLALSRSEVAVLSPITQFTGARRPSTMTYR